MILIWIVCLWIVCLVLAVWLCICSVGCYWCLVCVKSFSLFIICFCFIVIAWYGLLIICFCGWLILISVAWVFG